MSFRNWCLGSLFLTIAGILTSCGFLQKGNQSSSLVLEKQWVKSTLAREHYGFRYLHRMTPIVTDEWIIQGNSIDGLVAYKRKSGAEAWRFNIKNGVEAGAVLADDSLYFGAGDGLFYSLSVKDGSIRWTFPIRSEGLGLPTVQNGVVYFLAGNNVAYALDAKTGKQLWLYNRRDSSTLSIRGGSRPQISGDFVFLGFSDGFIAALKKNSGALVWERSLNTNKRFRDVDATPVLEGDRIYVSSYDGLFYCLKQSDGSVIWTFEAGGYWPATITPQRVYYSTTDGRVLALEKSTGRLIWTYNVTKGLATQPVLYKNLLLFGESRGALRVLEAQSGRELKSYFPGRGLQSTPHVDPATGEVFFISSNANLFALKLAWQNVWPWERQ